MSLSVNHEKKSSNRKKKSLPDLIRENKNKLTRNYFRFRINFDHDPYKIFLRTKPYKFLFILSHMRSGSSLLTHILSTNSELIGYGETHAEYNSEFDLKKLMLKVYLKIPEFRKLRDFENFRMHHQYVLDKVLHNAKFLDYKFLSSKNIYSVFLLREPQQSLRSLLDLKPHWNEETAVEYYSDRLRQLEVYARFINNPARSLIITYDQILNQTDLVLLELQQFLNTKQAFSENYQVLKTTGQPGVGDHKGNIKAGRIIRSSRDLNITVSDRAIALGQAAFEQCFNTLSQCCTTV